MDERKTVILGVSASIAAYKSAFLTRLMVKEGWDVHVAMSPDAVSFVSPLTFSTLSKNTVHKDFFDAQSGNWNNHVELGMKADAMVIAPATANTLAKMRMGVCDNALLAVYLSAKCPVFVSPAMDLDMWRNPATQENIKRLEEFGVQVIDVEDGELASGLSGPGRMAEPETILKHLKAFFNKGKPLQGKKVLITAGPTYEAIDPVRFIGNRSTGKMGIALAKAAQELGADTVLVLGPTHLGSDLKGIKVHRVESGEEMFEICEKEFSDSTLLIASAAVADYKPATVANEKMKKAENKREIELVPTRDILKSLSLDKKSEQITVGFALETQNEEENALIKLSEKNLDMVVLNSLKDAGAGFGHDTNKVKLIMGKNKIHNFELMSKEILAKKILDEIVKLLP